MAHCRNPILYKILLAKCPAKCGLCDKPGALGKCPDAHDSCPVIARFPDACNNERIAQMCMKTCNISTCLSGKFSLKLSLMKQNGSRISSY